MNKLIFAIILIFSTLSISHTSSIEKVNDEVENQKKIIQYFVKHDFPKNIKNPKGANLSVYHIVEKNREHLPNDEMQNDSQKCNNLYIVNFETKSIFLKYFYCLYGGEIIFLSAYELNHGSWKKSD